MHVACGLWPAWPFLSQVHTEPLVGPEITLYFWFCFSAAEYEFTLQLFSPLQKNKTRVTRDQREKKSNQRHDCFAMEMPCKVTIPRKMTRRIDYRLLELENNKGKALANQALNMCTSVSRHVHTFKDIYTWIPVPRSKCTHILYWHQSIQINSASARKPENERIDHGRLFSNRAIFRCTQDFTLGFRNRDLL